MVLRSIQLLSQQSWNNWLNLDNCKHFSLLYLRAVAENLASITSMVWKSLVLRKKTRRVQLPLCCALCSLLLPFLLSSSKKRFMYLITKSKFTNDLRLRDFSPYPAATSSSTSQPSGLVSTSSPQVELTANIEDPGIHCADRSRTLLMKIRKNAVHMRSRFEDTDFNKNWSDVFQCTETAFSFLQCSTSSRLWAYKKGMREFCLTLIPNNVACSERYNYRSSEENELGHALWSQNSGFNPKILGLHSAENAIILRNQKLERTVWGAY